VREPLEAAAGVQQPQSEVGDHEVVATATGVQPSAEVAEQIGHAPLDRGVHVLVGAGERERAVGDRGADPAQGVHDPRGVLRRQQAGGLQRPRVRDAGPHVVCGQPNVVVQRAAERVRLRRRRCGEPAGPQGLAAGAVVRAHGSSCPCTDDHTFSGRPQSLTKPCACDWSNASSPP
jgi:hypothetical protein